MSLISRINDLATRIAAEIKLKQNILQSGSNIKTINNESILGSGNITIDGGSGGSSVPVFVAADANNTHAIDVPTGSYFKVNAQLAYKTIQHLGSISKSFGSTSVNTLDLPGNLQAGDVVFIFIGSDGATPALPSGWTNVDNSSSGTEYSRTAYKIMGSTPDTSVSLSGLSTSSAGISMAFRNVHQVVFDVAPVVTTGLSGMPNPGAVTTLSPNAWVIAVGYLDDDNVQSSIGAPSGYSNLSAIQSTTTGQTVMASTKIVATPAVEDPAVYSGSGNDEWVALTIVLRPDYTAPQIAISNAPANVVTEIYLRVLSTHNPTWFSNLVWKVEPDFVLHNDELIKLITEDGTNWNAYIDFPMDEYLTKAVISGVHIDWKTAAVFTKALSSDITFTFSNLIVNKVITLVLVGSYMHIVTFPLYCKKLSGTYDSSTTNYIQLHCTNAENGAEEVWYTISKQEI